PATTRFRPALFVATMAVVYSAGADVDEESATLREHIRAEVREDGRPVYTPLTGLSLMIFFALACQCMSTLAVVKRETGGYRWPLFLFSYMTALAWLTSLLDYLFGRLLCLELDRRSRPSRRAIRAPPVDLRCTNALTQRPPGCIL